MLKGYCINQSGRKGISIHLLGKAISPAVSAAVFSAAVSAVICCLFYSISAAEVYRYVNKDGTVGYTDSLQAVPEKYRKSAKPVEGLREKEDTTAGSEEGKGNQAAEQKALQEPRKTLVPLKARVEDAVGGVMSGGYWRHIAVTVAFIVVFILIGKAGKALGHKEVWTVLRLLVVIGFMTYFIYAYTKEISDIYGSLREQVGSVKGKIEKRRVDEDKLGSDAPPVKRN